MIQLAGVPGGAMGHRPIGARPALPPLFLPERGVVRHRMRADQLIEAFAQRSDCG